LADEGKEGFPVVLFRVGAVVGSVDLGEGDGVEADGSVKLYSKGETD
jgi:hypothetical protein